MNVRNFIKTTFVTIVLLTGCQTPKDNTLLVDDNVRPIYPAKKESTTTIAETNKSTIAPETKSAEQPIEIITPQPNPTAHVDSMQQQQINELVQSKEQLEKKVAEQDTKIEQKDKELSELKQQQTREKVDALATTKAPHVEAIPIDDKNKNAAKQYYLRIITLEKQEYYEKMANQIVDHLAKNGIKGAATRVSKDKKSGKEFWVIDIAEVPQVAEDRKLFLKKIQEIKYQGTNQFQDAYYIHY